LQIPTETRLKLGRRYDIVHLTSKLPAILSSPRRGRTQVVLYPVLGRLSRDGNRFAEAASGYLVGLPKSEHCREIASEILSVGFTDGSPAFGESSGLCRFGRPVPSRSGISLRPSRPPLSAHPGSDRQSDSLFLPWTLSLANSLFVVVVINEPVVSRVALEEWNYPLQATHARTADTGDRRMS
jgi:hypothetical protein